MSEGFWSGSSISDWIPLFQSALWPAVVVGIAFWFRQSFIGLFGAIKKRIDDGSRIKATTAGVEIDSPPKMSELAPPPEARVAELAKNFVELRGESISQSTASATLNVDRPDEKRELGAAPAYYLIHKFRRDSRLDTKDYEYYKIKIWLDADQPEMLDQIASVVYELHPSFRNAIRVVLNRDDGFALTITAWGEFNIHAEIKFKGGRSSIHLSRYLNLSN